MLHPRVLALGRFVIDLGKTLPRMIGEDIRQSIAVGASDPRAFLDPGQFQQAMMNLIVNARDAMPNGGQLTIETDCVNLGADRVSGHPDVEPGGRFAMVSVADTGVGMDEEIRQRIFEPFFTTKEVGQGIGLGLAMVYGFVKQSGGIIECDSEPGTGTTFRLHFPLVDKPAEEPEPVPEVQEAPKGTETILLVEDERALRAACREMLQEAGYEVLEAADGPEALQRVEHHPGRIDMLMTDVVMPEMTGVELVERVRETRSDVAVLLVSGYGDQDLLRRGLSGSIVAILRKPFSYAGLTAKVREVLDAARTAAAD